MTCFSKWGMRLLKKKKKTKDSKVGCGHLMTLRMHLQITGYVFQQGPENVQAISLYYRDDNDKIDINHEAFIPMCKLRYLRIENPHINCPMGLEFLPVSVKYLNWTCYPLDYMPPNYNAEKLVQLVIRNSQHKEIIWSKPLKNLKRIDLRWNQKLMKISDLAVAPNLEILVLTACQNLVEVGSSLENLNKLTLLDVEDCQSLSNLPELPLSIKGLKLEGTGLRTLPSTIGRLTHFKKLSLRFCEQLESLPNSISSLSSFEELSLHQCSNLQKLPDDFGNLESLKELHAFNSGLRELPPSIQNIKVLRMLDLNGCMDLSKPPENFGNLESLEELDVSYTGLTELPPTIQNLNRLIKLYMIGCKELQSLPALPYNLGKFYARGRIRLLNRVSSSIMYQYFRKAHYQPTKYDGSSEMEYPFDRYQKSNEDYFYFISLERAPEVLLWNCSLECSFVQKVPFTLIDGNGRFTRNYGEEIIKCGIHPFFHS